MQNYIIISNVLIFTTYIIYEWAIFKKLLVPHKTTRFLLMIITILGFLSLMAQGDKVAVWLLGFSALHCTFIYFLSIKYGIGGWKTTDIVCLIVALIGIIVWRITKDPAIGLYAAVIADFISMIPTLIKTYEKPKTEFWLVYVCLMLASFFTLLAITNWHTNEFLYPLYLLIIGGCMLVLSQRLKIKKMISK